MLYLFYLIIFIEILTILYNLIKFIIFKAKRTNNTQSNICSSQEYELNILIPCFEETKVIEQTLKHFQNIINKIPNINIYVITTQKEDSNIKSSKISTYSYLSNLELFHSNKFNIIHYPNISGMMADQLNYGIEKILENSKLPQDRIYFSIYNADSNPDISTFAEINNVINNNKFPKIIQQYSNYFLNYNSQNFIMKGFSIYQTAFELRNGIINNKVSPLLYSHVVGHGLTIRADYINNINGFNTNFWCEDIFLTGLLFNNSEHILPLYSLDNAENPGKLSTQIIQNAVWFKTAFNHFNILKDIKNSCKITSKGFLWLAHEFRASLVWLLMPIFLLFSFIYPILIQNFKMFILSLATYLIFVFTNYLLNLIVVNAKRFSKYIKDYFSLAFAVLFTGLGPLYSFFLKEKIKTER